MTTAWQETRCCFGERRYASVTYERGEEDEDEDEEDEGG